MVRREVAVQIFHSGFGTIGGQVQFLLQLRVFRFGFLQDGHIEVGVFPQREKILVGDERPDAGGVGIRALRGSRLQGIGARHAQSRQRSCPAVPHNPAVVENLLKLGGGGAALPRSQVRLPSYVHGVEAGKISDE